MNRTALPDRDGYFDRWAAAHGGWDPRGNAWARGWLTITYAAAKPLARMGVSPDAVTVAAVPVTAIAVLLGAVDGPGRRPALAASALVVVCSALLDSLDGAVAVLTARTTRWGYVLDSVADRVTEALFLAALWVAGAPPGPCVLGWGLAVLQEYARSRAVAGGLEDVGVVTVWERATRVVVTAVFLLCAALLPYGTAALWTGLGAAAWCGLGAVGLGQLLVVLRRRLRD